ncbi:MAG TPA: hypothetical protein VHU87_02795, partial [Rhizomicrobium sp.]|nr:hypothetical protein [Rhizomicrobium sp.]
LQDLVQNAIVMPHGVARFPVQNVAKRLEHRRINAMRLVYKFKPDSRGTCPGMTVEGVMRGDPSPARPPRLRVNHLFVRTNAGLQGPVVRA